MCAAVGTVSIIIAHKTVVHCQHTQPLIGTDKNCELARTDRVRESGSKANAAANAVHR